MIGLLCNTKVLDLFELELFSGMVLVAERSAIDNCDGICTI